ncbi:uncharacterized protein LOC125177757 [Hyalella azteca]|uniref:Uncharacterized protein LOC125177757 n=1 Tax=Hyalella azteca TaxID=294128 RepID=A0A979FGJ8_HYAAZ|nr:uncharacterized protein LOC125177757 [Hyalella azteca]
MLLSRPESGSCLDFRPGDKTTYLVGTLSGHVLLCRTYERDRCVQVYVGHTARVTRVAWRSSGAALRRATSRSPSRATSTYGRTQQSTDAEEAIPGKQNPTRDQSPASQLTETIDDVAGSSSINDKNIKEEKQDEIKNKFNEEITESSEQTQKSEQIDGQNNKIDEIGNENSNATLSEPTKGNPEISEAAYNADSTPRSASPNPVISVSSSGKNERLNQRVDSVAEKILQDDPSKIVRSSRGDHRKERREKRADDAPTIFLSAAMDETIRVWSIDKPAAPLVVLRVPKDGGGGYCDACWCSWSQQLVAAARGTGVDVWDVSLSAHSPVLSYPLLGATTVAFTPTTRNLVVGDSAGNVHVLHVHGLDVSQATFYKYSAAFTKLAALTSAS